MAIDQLAQADLEAGIAKVALFNGGVITAKLELVFPVQLQDDLLQRLGWQGKQGEEEYDENTHGRNYVLNRAN